MTNEECYDLVTVLADLIWKDLGFSYVCLDYDTDMSYPPFFDGVRNYLPDYKSKPFNTYKEGLEELHRMYRAGVSLEYPLMDTKLGKIFLERLTDTET